MPYHDDNRFQLLTVCIILFITYLVFRIDPTSVREYKPTYTSHKEFK